MSDFLRRNPHRDDNQSHHHGKVSVNETPLYLNLSWRRTAADPPKRVGIFRLDLAQLLMAGYIRYDPADSFGPHVRLRLVRADGRFYVQVNEKGPRLLMA
jgi:hypothetical protein